MDKYEYNLKLDQIKSLCADEKFEAAAEIADTINWYKIKNVNALVKAGEVYEKVGRYEDSREILTLAYDRSPIGRMIIYRLAELVIKMKDYDAAEDYYKEFVEIAPHDNLRYVLRYHIRQSQGAPLEELIKILEEFKEQEYLEEWAYELAYLYHQAGQIDKCIEACDELILWFGDGTYVERALELKMLYQPLTKSQEEKYCQFRQAKDGFTHIATEEMTKAGEFAHDPVAIPPVTVNPGKYNTVNLQEEIVKGMQQIMQATEKATVSDTMDNIHKIVEEIPYLQIPRESESDEANGPHIESDEEIDGSLNINFKEMLEEESDGQISLITEDQAMVERQITGQMTIADILEEWEKTKRAAEAVLQEAEQRKLESAKARALQQAEDIMDRLNTVIPKLDAGVSPKELLEEEYLQGKAAVASIPVPEVAVSPVAPITGMEEVRPIEVVDGEEIRDTQTVSNVETVPVDITELTVEEEISEEELASDETNMEESSPEEVEFEDLTLEEDTVAEPETTVEADGINSDTGAIFENMKELLAKEIERISQETVAIDQAIAEAKDDKPLAMAAAEAVGEVAEAAVATGVVAAEAAATTGAVTAEAAVTTGAKAAEAAVTTGAKAAEAAVTTGAKAAETAVTTAASAVPDGATKRMPTIQMPEDLAEEKVVEKKTKPFVELTDDQKAIFSYFVPVKGMEDQICAAIQGISTRIVNHKPASTGNLIVQGGQGCGKTMLATSLIKVLQKETNALEGRIGKIDAAALNKKDAKMMLSKVSGGCLIIERAGDLNRNTMEILSDLLEKDESGLFLVLEDTSKGIKKVLSQNEEFAKKFTERINVPIFTNDELVSFAKSYSRELGYKIDEMAVLALYNRISNIQGLDQYTTITQVKEIVDEAIDNEAHGGLRKAFSILTAKRYTDDDRIVLTEKDFEE